MGQSIIPMLLDCDRVPHWIGGRVRSRKVSYAVRRPKIYCSITDINFYFKSAPVMSYLKSTCYPAEEIEIPVFIETHLVLVSILIGLPTINQGLASRNGMRQQTRTHGWGWGGGGSRTPCPVMY